MARAVIPAPLRRWIDTLWRRLMAWPKVGCVQFGNLRRLKPVSSSFGLDRGLCIDRYYIEKFLVRYAADIKGHVLEVADNNYTMQFGGSRVARSDVLHLAEGNPRATLVADLSRAEQIPSDHFDSIIVTQTLQFIYNVQGAMRTLHRILKPGGVLLATFPGISQISRYDMDRWGDYWRFTTLSAQRLFEEVFPTANVRVEAYGNVLAAIAFLHGLAAEELREGELCCHDPDYEVLIAVRAVKSRMAL
ncbi:MAG: methyltransferase domain-containing protein [Candidatus Binatia bacterium]